MPYPGRDGATGILKQNTGRQAAVIRLVGLARAQQVEKAINTQGIAA
jgi:hypothetical protein